LNLFAKLLAGHLCDLRWVRSLENGYRPQEAGGLGYIALGLPEGDATFLAQLSDDFDIFSDDFGWRHRRHLVDEVLLGRICHGLRCLAQDLQNDFVYLELDLFSLLAANIPDHVDLALFDLLLVEEQSDEILRSVHQLIMSIITEDMANDA